MYDLNYVFRSRDKFKKKKQRKKKQTKKYSYITKMRNTQINLCLFIKKISIFVLIY